MKASTALPPDRLLLLPPDEYHRRRGHAGLGSRQHQVVHGGEEGVLGSDARPSLTTSTSSGLDGIVDRRCLDLATSTLPPQRRCEVAAASSLR
jgi:hypothetical protein